MAYRNIFISSPAKISVKNSQLIVKTTEEYSFPLEDISSVLIESEQVTLTAARLSRCATDGVLVYLCDGKHMPCAVLTGFGNHSRKLKILQSQIDLRRTLKKHLWQDIVKRKIENQAKVLELTGKDNKELLSLVKKVKLNDEDNMEAVAASKYFRTLFGKDFSRDYEDITNARLNYGYSIVRGCVCRSLAVYGFEPSLGIHHKSRLNSFNLADDIMEVFRPAVDLCVRSMDGEQTSLTPKDKQMLFNLLNCDMLFDRQKYTISYAIEKTVQTLQNSYLNDKISLKLREIIPLRQHEYE
ncbi:MAG: type II CRISPR-associated endonuclease Cas1 [Oscillospiraceae bacterium]|nr:type II CRISPR-associated endonuclease Cas1 [Oscillospiraceae bacterium]